MKGRKTNTKNEHRRIVSKALVMKRNFSIVIIIALVVSSMAIIPVNAYASTFYCEPSDNHDFGTATIPYDVPKAHIVNVTRIPSTGEILTGSLSGDNPDCFTLSTEQLMSIPEQSSIRLTVIPKAGLAAGTYTATVNVIDPREYPMDLRLFDVSFKVSDFGVPATGVPDVAGITVAMCVFAIISVALWAFILKDRKFKQQHNG